VTAITRVAAIAVAAAVAVGTAALSTVPVNFSTEDQALVRLSWRMAGVTAEACRTLSPEDLAALPIHMRNPRACIGHIASYHLQVTLDGVLVLNDTVRPPGARGDRPLTVLRDLPVRAGTHELSVRFDALLPEGVEPPAEGVTSLAWEGTARLAGRQVGLVTLGSTARSLEYRTRRD